MFAQRLIKNCGLAAALCALLLIVPATAEASTSVDVKRAMNGLSGAAGAYAWNLSDGHAVAGRRQDTARSMASNTKLFTAASALLRFGTGGRFSTGIYSNGRIVNGKLSGDVHLRGGGDPLFGGSSYVTTYFGSRATLETLAARLKSAGVRKIMGGVYGDQGAFDARRGTLYSNWAPSSDIGGLIGGLIVDKGWTRGSFQRSPAVFAAQRLRAALRNAGIAITSSATGARTTPSSAARLAVVRSLPISALVRQMNKPSNNYLAEMLVKTLALPTTAADDGPTGGEVPLGTRPATTNRGSAAAVRYAADFGSRLSMVDGSGLSRSNTAAPREIVDLLRGMKRTVAFGDFRASLAIAGVDGTLAGRMRGSAAQRRCQAKTGTLSGVSSLSGYCTSAGGDLIAFSILQNGVSPFSARSQQDRLTSLIAGLR